MDKNKKLPTPYSFFYEDNDYNIVTLDEGDWTDEGDWINGYSIEHKATMNRLAWFPVEDGQNPQKDLLKAISYFLENCI